MWFIVKLCACASKFLTASRWNWFKSALFSNSSPSKAFPYPLSHRSNDILIWVNIVDDRCKPHFWPTYRWNRVKRASFSYSSTFNPFRHPFSHRSNDHHIWVHFVDDPCKPHFWPTYRWNLFERASFSNSSPSKPFLYPFSLWSDDTHFGPNLGFFPMTSLLTRVHWIPLTPFTTPWHHHRHA